MTDIVQLSAHGSGETDSYPVLKKWTYAFFCQEGEVLDWDLSVEVYNLLAKKDFDAVNKLVVDTAKGSNGDTVKNYKLWDLKDPNYASGLVLPGHTTAYYEFPSGTSEKNPIEMSHFLANAIDENKLSFDREAVIYVNACRS
ncbi:putative adhesin [Woodsholea maritima]|uniref:putative adhesin n=1 Tax=Woodsholea maritima TaxID=240237 RepID=UPI00036B39E8|nr:hypothetical protein [Woodsholea maritima]